MIHPIMALHALLMLTGMGMSNFWSEGQANTSGARCCPWGSLSASISYASLMHASNWNIHGRQQRMWRRQQKKSPWCSALPPTLSQSPAACTENFFLWRPLRAFRSPAGSCLILSVSELTLLFHSISSALCFICSCYFITVGLPLSHFAAYELLSIILYFSSPPTL